MMFFKTRSAARVLGRKVVDLGASAPVGRRWAVKVFG